VPENKTVKAGDDVELECRYISGEAAHVSWLKHYMVNRSYVDEYKVAYVNILQVLYVVIIALCNVNDVNYVLMDSCKRKLPSETVCQDSMATSRN